MGCDIHAYVEREEYDEYWYFAHVKIDRYYRLFSYMAGVRNHDGVKPVVEPRGLPKNVSMWIASEYQELEKMYSIHNTSWLSLEELCEVYRRTENIDLQSVIAMMSVLETVGQKSRLIFWFDN